MEKRIKSLIREVLNSMNLVNQQQYRSTISNGDPTQSIKRFRRVKKVIKKSRLKPKIINVENSEMKNKKITRRAKILKKKAMKTGDYTILEELYQDILFDNKIKIGKNHQADLDNLKRGFIMFKNIDIIKDLKVNYAKNRNYPIEVMDLTDKKKSNMLTIKKNYAKFNNNLFGSLSQHVIDRSSNIYDSKTLKFDEIKYLSKLKTRTFNNQTIGKKKNNHIPNQKSLKSKLDDLKGSMITILKTKHQSITNKKNFPNFIEIQ